MTANSANRQKASRKEMSRDRAGKRKRRCATKSDKDFKTLFNAQMFFCVSKMQILPLPLTLPPPACHRSTRIQYISIYLFTRERERARARASERGKEGTREGGKEGRREGSEGPRPFFQPCPGLLRNLAFSGGLGCWKLLCVQHLIRC